MPEKNDDDYIKFVRINQEAQLSLTNRAMHLCSMHNGHAVKHAPPTFVTVQNLAVLCQTLWAYIGLHNFMSAEAPTRWDGGVAEPLNIRPPPYTYIYICSLYSHTVL